MMINIELEGVIYSLPESADEVPGLCRSYDPPTDSDGGCLKLLENQVFPFHGTRQELWAHCATSPTCSFEGQCPFMD